LDGYQYNASYFAATTKPESLKKARVFQKGDKFRSEPPFLTYTPRPGEEEKEKEAEQKRIEELQKNPFE